MGVAVTVSGREEGAKEGEKERKNEGEGVFFLSGNCRGKHNSVSRVAGADQR